MPRSPLPERASLEYLKKLAKERLQELRRADPRANLASAQLAVARDRGFSSWRALKAALEKRSASRLDAFFAACRTGEVDALREHLRTDPGLVRVDDPRAQHRGWTALHAAAGKGHDAAVRLLLEHSADANAREAGDNTLPLHWAAARRHAATVRALLDAGSDVHGHGDDHQLDVIGWATVFGEEEVSSREVVPLLLERGARHHVFSAIASNDLQALRALVAEDPGALARRRSRFEGGGTALHFAVEEGRHDVLDLLVELGADLEAEDDRGHTALATAMLRGDWAAVRRLHAAGARSAPGWSPTDTRADATSLRARMAALAGSVRKGVPMLRVPDVAATLDWYVAIGFRELARYGGDDGVSFGMVSFGEAEVMIAPGAPTPRHQVSLWFYTDRIDALYELLRGRQLEAARAALAGEPDPGGIDFVADLHAPFYGGREFGIRDPNGFALYFTQTGA